MKLSKKWNNESKIYPYIICVVLTIFSFLFKFHTLEAFLYDLQSRFGIGVRDYQRVIVIELDEESDQFLGERFPYTYATQKKFFKNLRESQPSVISYLYTLPELDSFAEDSEKENFKEFRNEVNLYKLGRGRFRFGTEMDLWGEQLPPEGLRDLGYALALLHVDSAEFSRDDVSRRSILNISGENSLHLWVANNYKEMKGKKRKEAKDYWGSYYSHKADATYALFRFTAPPKHRKNWGGTIPYHRVVVGNFPENFFKGKVVLIGPNYHGRRGDDILTPLNRDGGHSYSKMEVHAQVIESLISGNTIARWPDQVNYFLALVICLLLSYFLSYLRPTEGLLLVLFTALGLIIMSYLSYSYLLVWIKLVHLLLAVFISYYVWIPYRAIAEHRSRYAIEEETKLLKKVDNLKQNFISLMSHDLKTPVAKIAGMAEVLLVQLKENSKERENAKKILNATGELNKFITSILDLTKVESSQFSINKVSKDLNVIVENVAKSLQDEAREKKMSISLDLAPLYPIQIDVELIRRVLCNLIENALKYAGPGSQISVKTWDDEEMVYLEIRDNGIGIAEDGLEHVFEKFYRVKNDTNLAVKGSGLGLYLVKYFIELHEGAISVSSELGKGTAFLVKLRNA